MFGIGFQELVLLSLIGLVVLGPERLPRVANQIGGWLGQARRMTRVMKRQLEDEINFDKDFNIKPPNREPSTQPVPETPSADEQDSPADEIPDPNAADGEAGDAEDDVDLAVTTTGEHDNEAPANAPAATADAREPDSKDAS